MSAGDTAWVLVSTALVVMMTPALAFFYGGMVRSKNIVSTLGISFVCMALIGVQWVLFGYSLAFAPSVGGFIGDLSHFGLAGIGVDDLSGTIPTFAFVGFQMAFAMIAPALITGAYVERINWKGYLIFSLLWATLIYDPVAHWVWGPDGFLGHGRGVLDFAGGAVIHITAGVSALAIALVIRKRKSFVHGHSEPHNIPYVVLGAGLLWAGWFGFNGGSSLAADGVAAVAIINSNTAAAAAALVWMFLAWLDGKPSIMGIATGAVVGLVAVTPAAGFVTPLSALIMGAVGAPISYYTISFVNKRGIDESLDVFACHGMAGIWGALATGLFSTTTINAAASDGLFYGNPAQFMVQLYSVVVVGVFAFVVAYALAKAIDAAGLLSVSTAEEGVGLDISQHGEQAYSSN